MKITPATRKAINQKAREVAGSVHHCEVGSRVCICEYQLRDSIDLSKHVPVKEAYFNLVHLDGHETDLSDMTRLSDLKEVEDSPDGRCRIDVWVYTFTGFNEFQLWTNLTVLMENGNVVSITE